jgi:hypothetical protein
MIRLDAEEVIQAAPWSCNVVVMTKIKLEQRALAIDSPFKELRQRVDLIVVLALGKCEILLDEVVAPGHRSRKDE